MKDAIWMRSVRSGKEILLGICEGSYTSPKELAGMLSKEIEKLQSGMFLAANEKTRAAHAIFITKDPRAGMEKCRKNFLSVFKKDEIKNAEFIGTKGVRIGIAEITTGFIGQALNEEQFKKIIKESFEGLRKRLMENLIKKGYSQGKLDC